MLLSNILYVRAFAGGLAISLSIYARLLLLATTLFAVTVVVVVGGGVVVVVVVVVHLSSLFSGVAAAAAVAVVFEHGGEALFGFLLERGVGGDGVFDDSLLGSLLFLLFF